MAAGAEDMCLDTEANLALAEDEDCDLAILIIPPARNRYMEVFDCDVGTRSRT